MPPAVYQLLGYPGTGKYTVGRALVARLEELGATARLVDNHAISNLILGVVPTDGRTPPPPEVWERAGRVRVEVIAAIEQLSPPSWSFVFTNYWQDTEAHAIALARMEELARNRGSHFVPVVLTCDPDEVVRRVVRPERAERKKLIDPAGARACLAQDLLVPLSTTSLTVDVTSISPAEAAVLITEHTRSLADDQASGRAGSTSSDLP